MISCLCEQQQVSTWHFGKLMAIAFVLAGYQKAGGLPGMQQPALPNLNMASRAGIQPGGGSTMYQQVHNSAAYSKHLILLRPSMCSTCYQAAHETPEPCLAPYTAGPAGALSPVL